MGTNKFNYDTNKLKICDFHTHILPEVDDGSQSAEQSVEMLRELYFQGVRRVLSTSHFYPYNESPDEFIRRRDAAVDKLKSKIAELGETHIPEIYLGAEVAYFNGMSFSREISKLCICGTSYMLIEMPFSHWSSAIIDEICAFKDETKIIPILAHIERYRTCFNEKTLNAFIDNDVLIQVNGEAFTKLFDRAWVCRMIGKSNIHVIGSDCHNMSDRAPNINCAINGIISKFGIDEVERINSMGNFLLKSAERVI